MKIQLLATDEAVRLILTPECSADVRVIDELRTCTYLRAEHCDVWTLIPPSGTFDHTDDKGKFKYEGSGSFSVIGERSQEQYAPGDDLGTLFADPAASDILAGADVAQ